MTWGTPLPRDARLLRATLAEEVEEVLNLGRENKEGGFEFTIEKCDTGFPDTRFTFGIQEVPG